MVGEEGLVWLVRKEEIGDERLGAGKFHRRASIVKGVEESHSQSILDRYLLDVGEVVAKEQPIKIVEKDTIKT